jgi:hypothetical protein
MFCVIRILGTDNHVVFVTGFTAGTLAHASGWKVKKTGSVLARGEDKGLMGRNQRDEYRDVIHTRLQPAEQQQVYDQGRF